MTFGAATNAERNTTSASLRSSALIRTQMSASSAMPPAWNATNGMDTKTIPCRNPLHHKANAGPRHWTDQPSDVASPLRCRVGSASSSTGSPGAHSHRTMVERHTFRFETYAVGAETGAYMTNG